MTQGPAWLYYDNGTPKNRLGLNDAEVLVMIERDVTTARLEEIHNGSVPEMTRSARFDLAHLQAIHPHTFQDIYARAGVTRNHPFPIGNRMARPLLYFIRQTDGCP